MTKWLIESPTEKMWIVLKASNYGDWWKGVTVNILEPGDGSGLGEVRESLFKTKLSYALSFKNKVTKLEYPSLIVLEAFRELEGFGRYDIKQDGDITEVI